jgi:DHA1 family solute carrier family 18 vesicular amine transporter 1/2
MSLRQSRAVAVALVTFATFTDIVAYSIAVPVLPDLSRRLGASPTIIGFLFASFGVTLLTVSIPMGAVSDRIGRKAPMVGGLVALAASTLLFAFADGLPWLFAARLVQGAADAVTWVVGFALIADLYGDDERGRIAGIVLSGTSFAVMIGPSLGGWLYELGGIRLPFLFVTALSVVAAAAFVWLRIPSMHATRNIVPIRVVLSTPAIASCGIAVIVVAATLSMLEPVMALHLSTRLGVGPARIGLVFGVAAVATMILNPIYGRLADRYGARRLTMTGLMLEASALPLLPQAWSYESAVGLNVLHASMAALAITASLAYMGEATSEAGIGSFGVSYGLYNMAWGAGLLGGPALGGFLFERMGFARLALVWAPVIVAVTLLLARAGQRRIQVPPLEVP